MRPNVPQNVHNQSSLSVEVVKICEIQYVYVAFNLLSMTSEENVHRVNKANSSLLFECRYLFLKQKYWILDRPISETQVVLDQMFLLLSTKI